MRAPSPPLASNSRLSSPVSPAPSPLPAPPGQSVDSLGNDVILALVPPLAPAPAPAPAPLPAPSLSSDASSGSGGGGEGSGGGASPASPALALPLAAAPEPSYLARLALIAQPFVRSLGVQVRRSAAPSMPPPSFPSRS